MKEIPLTQGKTAIVDDEDFEWLNQYKWYANKSCGGYTFYAERAFYTNGRKGKRFILLMHREILGMIPGDGRMCDHRNRNGLDNMRKNLRETTSNLNNYNTPLLRKSNTSGFRGVTWNKIAKLWVAQISIEGKHLCLGYFPKQKIKEAALSYDSAAIKYYGDNAILNFPQEKQCQTL